MNDISPILDWITTQETHLLQYVKMWTLINSWSLNPSGLKDMKIALEEAFSSLNGSMQAIPLPPRKIVNKDGDLKEVSSSDLLFIKKRQKAPIQILFSGHMDTVFSPDSLFTSIEEISPFHWKGPGILDMKSGLAILLVSLMAFESSPLSANVGWEIFISPDEEIGSPASAPLLANAANRHDLALVFEPTIADGAFARSRMGSTNLTVVVKGTSAHVGRDYHKGKSAIASLISFLSKIKQWQIEHPEIQINFGTIEGGTAANIIPHLASSHLNARSANEFLLDQFHQSLEIWKEDIQKNEGVEIQVIQTTFRPPKPFNKTTQALFNLLETCANDLHIPFSLRDTGGVCDGNILAHAGLPVIDTMGAVGADIHTTKEYLVTSSLVERTKLCTLLLLKIASGGLNIKHRGQT